MKSKLAIVTDTARGAGGNELVKAQYKRLALNVLRSIARDLQLAKGTYSIRFNAGGPAVAGDAVLHHDRFYLSMSEAGVYWRTCEGQKDYHGGPNRWAWSHGTWSDRLTVPELVEQIQSVLAANAALRA